MKINTDNHATTYGRHPKASDLQAWSFLIQGREGEYTEFRYTGTYQVASRLVKAEAKQIGRASAIFVNS